MGGAEVTQFLSALLVDRNVAASTQNQALSAILHDHAFLVTAYPTDAIKEGMRIWPK